MIQKITLAILAIFLIVQPTLTIIDAKYEPIMVAALWRHGTRTSREDKFKIVDKTKFDPKDLIGNGARMHYILGQQLS